MRILAFFRGHTGYRILVPRNCLATALGICCSLVLCSSPIFAQDIDISSDENDEDAIELARFSVTGYSIKRSEIEGPAPVDVYQREELEQAGINTLGEFSRNLPQSLNPISEGSQGSGYAGSAYIDLRGIGIDNTLTLINGKRVSAYALNGSSDPFVDINAIPVSAIERIEILKDGASAIYGADAVAGVVNIILRENFDGLQLGGSYLTTTEGDGDEWNADLVWGWNNDSTSVLVTLAYFNKSPILSRDRELTANVDYTSQNGPDLRAFDSTPATYFNLEPFEVFPDPECGIDPNISGVVSYPFFGGDFCLFNYAWFQQLTYETETLAGNLIVKHDFNPGLRGRFEVFYSHRDNTARLAPTPVRGGVIPADHPDNPYGAWLQLLSRPLDAGDRTFETTADTYRVIAGLEGTWTNWDWTADLVASGTNVDTDRLNAVFSDRYHSALAGMGGPSGNLWYNPFGANPQNDPAVIDWMTTSTKYGADSTENAIEVQASTLFGNLPGGPVGFAAGLQFRKQKLDEYADEVERSGMLAGGNLTTQINADRNIFAAYMEFSLPLLATLEAQAAVRYDHYSDFGGTTNPKIALAWRPSSDWLVRASYSTSFRPPSFTELFNPAVLNGGFYSDVERCEGTGAGPDCGPWNYAVLDTGNPDLQPEEGKSFFAGFIWSPEFFSGFDLEIDYWQFKHSDRIIQLDPQLILNAKSNKGVTRFPPTEADMALGVPGRIEELTRTFENSDELKTNGIDVIARFSRQTDSAGIFNLSLMYTYISEYTLNEATVGSAETGFNFAGKYFNGQFGIPRHRGNLNFVWELGSHSVAANIIYVGDYEGRFNLFDDGVPTEVPLIVDDRTTLDLQYSFLFTNQRTIFRLGCKNCFNQDPPVTFNNQGEGLYDYRGAMVYARVQHHF